MMYLTIGSTEYNLEVKAQIDDDSDSDEVMEKLTALMITFGYHPKSVIRSLTVVKNQLTELYDYDNPGEDANVDPSDERWV